MVAQFCDVSQFQPDIDWQAYKSWSASFDGVSRVAMRSSYGYGYRDANFNEYRAGALAAGIDSIIYYHYSYPSLNAAITEANWQRSVVGDIRPQDFVILDFEENVDAASAQWAYTWLVTQEANYRGKLPGLYASSAYIAQRLQDPRLERYPLWEANWKFTPDERPPVPYPWKTRAFLQYTDRATSIPGIPGVVDCNIFLGKEEDPSMSITLSSPGVSQYFKANGATWQSIKTGFLIGGAILDFYKSFGGTALCGLSLLGLPETNEIGVTGHPGVTYQRFERAVVVFDPSRVNDSPPGIIGQVYLAHIDSGIGVDPRVGPLQTQNALLQSQVADLQNQLSGNVLAQENQALLSKIAKAQEDLT